MINVGITGLGFMGMIHYLAYQRISGCKVTAICEQIPERLEGDWRSIKGNFGPRGKRMDLSGIAKYRDFEEILADPNVDVVDICLPPAAHAEMTIRALKAGKHVFCEKPIAIDAADAAKMVATAKSTGKLLLIGHVLPFFAAYRYAYRAVAGGKFGKMIGGHFKRIICDPKWMQYFWDPEHGGGPMIDLNIHDFHFVRLLCGMPKAVQTVGTMRDGLVELFNSQFLFDSPMVVTVQGGVIDQPGRPFTNGYEIYLEKATLAFDSWAELPVTLLTNDGRTKKPKLSVGDPVDDFAEEMKEVIRAVRTNTPSALLDGELARDALIMAYKQTQSAVKRKMVKI